MKVRALCWVNCGGWHRAGEVFDVEDPSALPGLVEPVEEETDSSAPAEASAQNDGRETDAVREAASSVTADAVPPSPQGEGLAEEPKKTVKKRGRKA